MSTATVQVIILLCIVAAGIALAFYLSRVRVGTAVREVVRRFREKGATSPESAVSPAELGIISRNLLSPKLGLRDYKPDALKMLAQMGIVKPNDEGRLYLSEEDLERSRMKAMAKID